MLFRSYVGKFYYKHKEYNSSVVRFAVVADEYPKLGFDEQGEIELPVPKTP